MILTFSFVVNKFQSMTIFNAFEHVNFVNEENSIYKTTECHAKFVSMYTIEL
jgi:hypothetical protein